MADGTNQTKSILMTNLDMLAKTGWMGVCLRAPPIWALVGLRLGVDVHVLLAIAAVREHLLAAVELALEWLFAYKYSQHSWFS